MKTSTLIRIAAQVQNAMNVKVRGSVNEVTARVVKASTGCRTKMEAAKAIAAEFGHVWGEHQPKDAQILDSAPNARGDGPQTKL